MTTIEMIIFIALAIPILAVFTISLLSYNKERNKKDKDKKK